jgi:tRNA dimethylallyltransferase
MPLHPLIAILGPTASGKSDLALTLAERLGGEIVNYDSVQVYRGFDIGSAKTPEAERRGIGHHLIDILDPSETFSAGAYARLARQTLDQIRARGNVPVLVGGTGLYLKALLHGLFQGPSRDDDLRRRLERSAQSKPAAHLHRLLDRLDPRSAARIHPNDQPKLVRAIEVRLLEGAPLSSLLERGMAPLEGYRIVRLLLDPPRQAIYERINRRAEAMFANGLVDELRSLLASGVPRDAWPLGALGYRQALAVLEGTISVEQAVEDTAKSTRNYAKRQLTWFRRQEPQSVTLVGFGTQPELVDQAWGAASLTPPSSP